MALTTKAPSTQRKLFALGSFVPRGLGGEIVLFVQESNQSAPHEKKAALSAQSRITRAA
jgi:hypothetical protein